MVAYFRCICRSSDKLKAAELQKQGVEVRNIKHNPEWRKQAKSYGLPMPFIVDNGQARPL